MPDVGDILDLTLNEANRILEEMGETKDLDKRKSQSEVLNNLCQSAGVFFDLMSAAIGAAGFPDLDEFDGEEGFDEDD